MPGSYPRLNRGAIRAKVRTLTAIESTNLVTDAHINNIINEELHKIVSIADELEQFWVSQPGGGPIQITETGVTYRIPGWRFDNTTQFPSGLPGNFYLNADNDTPPWNTTGLGVHKAGYFDNFLVYAASSRLLREQDDDSKRSEEFDARAKDIADLLIQQEYVAHNADQTLSLQSNDPNFFIRLYFKVLYLLKTPLSIDSDYAKSTVEIASAIYDSQNELLGKYKWTGYAGSFSFWNPYGDIFSYAAAARVGVRFGLSEVEVASLMSEYQRREDALVREKLTNNTGNLSTSTAGAMVNQVSALLRDFSTELPQNLIYNWINTEYQLLATEHDWPWLTQEAYITVPAGLSSISLSFFGVDYSILNVYKVKQDGNGNTVDVQIVPSVPHTLDGLANASQYRYDITDTFMNITPTPTESTTFAIRYKTVPGSLLTANAVPLFKSEFAAYLVYRAAYLGSVWSDQAKKLSPMFESEAQRVKDMMYQYYMTDRSTEPFSIGESGLETRKYLPFFKAV
jgi:hypothetical protein